MDVVVVPRCPVEIVREIFEIAAQTDLHTSCSLSLVCSASRAWTEPILYETVILESARALRAFALAIATKPAGFVARRVRHLGIFAPGPFPAIHRVLAACAGVTSFACGFSLPHYIKQYHGAAPGLLPREQHLLGLSCRDGWDPSVLGRGLTHLRMHLNPSSWDPTRLADLAQFQALTHLAIVYRQSDGLHALLPMLRSVLGAVPGLQLLLVQVLGARLPSGSTTLVDDLNQLASHELHDLRLVAEAAPFSTSRQWESASRGGVSIWSEAERQVHARIHGGW
ncbi:hypothetical protein BV25DRAFT_1830442 [Artomyces pyxidatus]|uniref:Uncharacterized protein n=1 Tax=Artomyces pyxidatus TaxID=48021 RepID=A0ACB8SQR4_9AGAM|nr:hypothetical protein BV25DRAFT_1830442 [Artomyces pyxidatus]